MRRVGRITGTLNSLDRKKERKREREKERKTSQQDNKSQQGQRATTQVHVEQLGHALLVGVRQLRALLHFRAYKGESLTHTNTRIYIYIYMYGLQREFDTHKHTHIYIHIYIHTYTHILSVCQDCPS